MERKPILEEWPGPWAAWAEQYCYKNYWRIETSVGSMQDAMAECALMYAVCRKRYGGVVNSPAHFMSLFKVSVINQFNDLSVKQGRIKHIDVHYRQPEAVVSEGTVIVALREASSELQAVVGLLTQAPQEALQAIFGGARLTTPQFLYRANKHLGGQKSGEQLQAELASALS